MFKRLICLPATAQLTRMERGRSHHQRRADLVVCGKKFSGAFLLRISTPVLSWCHVKGAAVIDSHTQAALAHRAAGRSRLGANVTHVTAGRGLEAIIGFGCACLTAVQVLSSRVAALDYGLLHRRRLC